MKHIILFLLLIYSISATATDYYISATGSDSNNGTAPETPWQTLGKVNTFTGYMAGDNLLFKKNDGWAGILIVKQTGLSGSPITYGTYGTGATPTITGFTTVSLWTNLGSNIWESTNAVSTLITCNVVSINGENTAMGRTPNIDGIYTVNSHSGNTSLTSSELTGTPDWSGAMAVIRKERWDWVRSNITSQSGSTISTTDEQSAYTTRDGFGFFIQNDVRTLDVQNEWYFNPTTKKIRIYSSAEPVNVKVGSTSCTLRIKGKNYINIDGLKFEGANDTLLNANTTNYLNLQNCTFSFSGNRGAILSNADNCTINLCSFDNCATNAIFPDGTSDNLDVTNNNIANIAMLIGAMRLYPSAISSYATNSLIKNNVINTVGYSGIAPVKDSTIQVVQNNYIINSMLVLDDGGGIYTRGDFGDMTGTLIDGNVIVNARGYNKGTIDPPTASMACGVYLDIYSQGVVISNNSIYDCGRDGIFLSRSKLNTITGNTCYANGESGITFTDYTTLGKTVSNAMNNNKFVETKGLQQTARFKSSINDTPLFLSSSDNNYFVSLPANKLIYVGQPDQYSGGNDKKTLSQWKTFSGKDNNSKEAPFAISLESDFRFEYNATATQKTVTLDQNYRDLVTNSDHLSVTLDPYSSIILLKHAPYASSSGRKDLMYHGKKLHFNGKTLRY